MVELTLYILATLTIFFIFLIITKKEKKRKENNELTDIDEDVIQEVREKLSKRKLLGSPRKHI